MKSTWLSSFDSVNNIFEKADLVSLIAEGAPADEYEVLALEVFTKVKTDPAGKESLEDFIKDSIKKGFGDQVSINESRLRDVVNEIRSAFI